MLAKIYKAIYEKVLSVKSRKQLCCVCLQAITGDISWIHDEIKFKFSSTLVVDQLAHILEELTGESYADVSNIFGAICHICKETTINNYCFIQKAKQSCKMLYTAIENLEECFADVSQSILDNSKSMFVQIDLNVEPSSEIRRYYDNVSCDSITIALERITLMLGCQDKTKLEVCHEHSNKTNTKIKPDMKHAVENDVFHSEFTYGSQEELENLQQEVMLTEVASEIRNLKHFYCPDCKAGFNCLERYKKHRTTKKKCTLRGRGQYSCHQCNYTAVYKTLLTRHIRFQHNSRTIVCEWCGKSCNSHSELKTHIIKHNDERNFICQECGGKFKSAFSLKNHMTLHTGERNYPCNFCDESFRNASSRNEHTRRHHVQDPVQCDVCDKVFKVREDLLRHKRNHSLGIAQKAKFPCSECAHRAYSKKQLEGHIKFKHHGERPFQCEICYKNYGTEKMLKIHMSTHTGKTYNCKECDQSFKSLFGIKSHMFKHTGKKPYPCSFCEQTFKDSNRRLEHVRRHHVFEPHVCDICKKVYRTRGDLCRHKKGHTAGLTDTAEESVLK